MLEFLVVIRNLVLFAIMAFLGLQAAPNAPDKDEQAVAPASQILLLGR